MADGAPALRQVQGAVLMADTVKCPDCGYKLPRRTMRLVDGQWRCRSENACILRAADRIRIRRRRRYR